MTRVDDLDGGVRFRGKLPEGWDYANLEMGFVPVTHEVWVFSPLRGRILIFDPELEGVTFEARFAPPRKRTVRHVTFSPDGRGFATQIESGRIDVWSR